MNAAGVSPHQLRIAIAVLSFALFAQTAFWLVYDIVVYGLPTAWTAWTSGDVYELSATSSLDLGLAAIQLAAGLAALQQTRAAGGLLVTACTVTLGFRLPVVWYFLLDSPSDPWFGTLTGPSVSVVGGTAILAVLVALVLGALLLVARHMEYEAAAASAVIGGRVRPVKVTAAASGLLLAVLNVFYIGRNAVTAFDVGPGVLGDLLVGKGSGRAVLGVSSAYQWACLTVLCGAGMLLAARRRPVATGFSVGLSLFMMPSAFTGLWAYATGAMSQTLVGASQNLLEFVGSAAVVALIIGDIRSDRRPRADAAGFGAPAEPAAPSAPSTPAEVTAPAEVTEAGASPVRAVEAEVADA
ncbi:hypothetical protein ACFWVC_11040 [Streptomyces sp. NPDC058691]|uniref:hypothetical protein n=1 Tax=Streptomyces sp. NPDC058691 TaxID=3346601 RepID=UPI00365B09BF